MGIKRAEYLIGTTTEWAERDVVLPAGQLAVESTIDAIKIGDGATPWSLLDYVTPGTSGADVVDGGTP